MTIALELSPELEDRLTREAQRMGLPTDQYAVWLLNQNLPTDDRRTELVELLQSWIDDDDVEEQKETGDYLIHALDEDRLSDRKLFPKDLEGVSW